MATPFETEMGVLPEIAKAISDMEWNLPTDIQSDAIPLILGGGDVLMAAETGSGKTGAFCLPVLQIVYESMLSGDKKATPSTTSSAWKMNVFDRTSAMAIDNEGVLCQSRDKGGWHSCRANKGVHGPGKYYFEATVTDDGLCRVGWATLSANLELGTCANSFGFGGTGKKSHRKNFETYGESFSLSDTIGNCIDFDNNEIRWTKNGVDLGVAYQIPQNLRRENFFPALSVKNAEIRFNFTPDKPPQGYLAISKAVPARVVASSNLGSVESINGSGSVEQKKRGPMAIIIEPSRELAEQTYNQLVLFSKHLTAESRPRTCLVVGGGNTREQQRAISDGTEIVVATPGRLNDLVASGVLALSNCRFLVLDECDGLLAAGNKQLLTELHSALPKVGPSGERLQVIVCSATLHSFEVKKLADAIMQFPQWVDLKGEDSVPDTVHHLVCMVDPTTDKSWQTRMSSDARFLDDVHAKDRLSQAVETPELLSQAVKLAKLQLVVDAVRTLKMDRALIFCRTKLDCDQLEQRFVQLGGGPRKPGHQFSCVCLHSDRNQGERKANLETFKRGDVRFMICTDVAARGLDIRGLPYESQGVGQACAYATTDWFGSIDIPDWFLE